MLNILLALCLNAHAEEGFNFSDPPAALTTAWNGTVLLYTGTTGDIAVTSAVVVRHEGDEVDLLTVLHTLDEGCTGDTCDKIRVLRDPRFNWKNRQKVKDKSMASSLRVVARDADHDLALLRMKTVEKIEPVLLAAKCDTDYALAFAFGFPVTANRTEVLKINEPKILRRRWSTGHVIGRAVLNADASIFFGKREGGRDVMVTSADTMPGGSGGPLVGDDGTVIGLVDRQGGKDEVPNYRGRGKAESSQINAIATPCEVIRTFLATAAKG